MAARLVILFAILGLAQCKLLDLSCKNVRKIVDGHNSKRLQLAKGEVADQPAAGKMKSMVWDEELAAKAASWASQNPSGHNPDRTVPSGKFTTGENIYWYSTTASSHKLDPSSAIQAWFDEHKDYTYGPLKWSDFASPKQIGHYTQMIWSDSTHVGCAIARGADGSWTKFTVVCNYGPAGNMIGETPYSADKRGTGKLTCGAGDCSQPYGHKC